MKSIRKSAKSQKGFNLSKWFLDFISDEGEAMIFYAAKLKWHGLEVTYTSWLRYNPANGVSNRSRFHRINMPERNDSTILWSDHRFGVEGKWKTMTSPLQARLFESDEGYLDWNCFQPMSEVSIKIKDKTFEGIGYAEQLVMTVDPWKIPMNELRWGRYGTQENYIVWIEVRADEKQQWIWLNGEKINKANIEDNQISIPTKKISLELDKSVVLESEQKIFHVVKKLRNFLPGFKRSMPIQFLMADEYKWLSKGILKKDGKEIDAGPAIHEFVNFKSQPK